MESYANNSKLINRDAEKKSQLEAYRNQVELMIDNLGLGVDEGIKETVTVLLSLGLPTSSSCFGHTEENSFSPPYVEICAKAPIGWKDDKDKQKEWKEENIKNANKLISYLDAFYKLRDVTSDSRLTLHNIGIFGGFRLEANGTYLKAEELDLKTKEDIFKKIKQYQEEMTAFTAFLVNQY